jgi:uncharacterized protein DUF1552
MFLIGKHIPRRTFLRGVGVAVGLPLLDAMTPALRAQSARQPIHRLGFMYSPNGANQSKFMPTGEGTAWEFSPTMSPLADFREHLFIPSYLANRESEEKGDSSDHSNATSGWLNGVHPGYGRASRETGLKAGTSADQMAAAEFGKETRLDSLQLAMEPNNAPGAGSAYNYTISWRTPTTPLPGEANPRVVFERLFGDGGSAEQQAARMHQGRSILDSLLEEVNRLTSAVGPSDRKVVNDYLDAIRENERRIEQSEKQGKALPMLPDRPLGPPPRLDDWGKMLMDLQVLAYQGDLTRVVSMVIGREQGTRTYPEIGVPENHHSISHHANDPEKLAKQAIVDRYHVQLFAYLLGKLKSTPDGAGGTLLDNSLFLFGTGLGNSDVHAHHDLNIVLAGGKDILQGGRHVIYAHDTKLSNLLVSMLDKVGLHDRTIGDSTGTLAGV